MEAVASCHCHGGRMAGMGTNATVQCPHPTAGLYLDNETLLNTSYCHGTWTNRTPTQDPDYFILGLQKAVLVSYIPTFLLGLTGNGLVILVIACHAQLRSKAYHIYIWNLALADMFFTLTMPFYCYATFVGNWVFGNFVCKFGHVVRETNQFASVFSLAALSVDRFLASYYELDGWRTQKVGLGVCGGVWLACTAISVPYWVYAEAFPSQRDGIHYCRIVWPTESLEVLVPFWAFFKLIIGLVVPFAIIVVSYAMLAVRLRRIMRQSSTRRVARPSRKMTVTVLVVVVAFLLCQTPYATVELISWKVFHDIRHKQVMPTAAFRRGFLILNNIAQILVFVSSCCNPILYGLTNNDYSEYKHVTPYCTAWPTTTTVSIDM